MNTIELMLEAIRQAITVMEIDTPNSEVLDLCYKSLSEGEAELRRAPIGHYSGSESEYGYDLLTLYAEIEFGTALYIREEIK